MRFRVLVAVLVGLLGLAPASRAGILIGPITNPANGHAYYLLTQNNWTNSEAEAISLGGHLATINDAAENDWVFDTFSSSNQYGLWIGLNDQASEGTFVWSSGEPVTYTNWASGQPDNSGPENFGMIFVNEPGGSRARLWNDFRDASIASPGNPELGLYGVVESVVPEPTSIVLCGVGAFCLLATQLKRRMVGANRQVDSAE